eukprot:1684368-Amphidinium_carterae.1
MLSDCEVNDVSDNAVSMIEDIVWLVARLGFKIVLLRVSLETWQVSPQHDAKVFDYLKTSPRGAHLLSAHDESDRRLIIKVIYCS